MSKGNLSTARESVLDACMLAANMEEALDPFEACDGDWTPTGLGWLSPRISFSQDFAMLERISPEKRKRELGMEDDYSSEFEFSKSVSVDLPSPVEILSADELFFDGKLRPLARPARISREEEELPRTRRDRLLSVEKEPVPWAEEEKHWPASRHQRSFIENPRCASMTIEGARGHPRRSCISLNNSRCASPSRSFSLPPTTPASPKASSSKYSSKFKDFFKLKKMQVPSSKEVPSSEVARESTTPSSSCRLPISPRSFWPFSRSNSAGEKKSAPVVSLSPRRSNSAGESKTSSSSLVPPRGNATSEAKAGSSTNASAKLHTPSSSQEKKGLPPLPNWNAKKSGGSHSFLVPANCGTDAVALSSQSACSSTAIQLPPSSSVPISRTSIAAAEIQKSVTAADIAIGSRANSSQWDSVVTASSSATDHHENSDSTSSTGRARGSSSPGRPVRRPSSNPARNFARGSPGRRGSWNSPGRGNSGSRGGMRSLERGTGGPKGLVRSKDMRNREGWKVSSDRPIAYNTSVRVTPVLNVPACITPSLRGAKASSKSKLFGLGNLFSKRDKAAYTVLPPTNSQSGA